MFTDDEDDEENSESPAKAQQAERPSGTSPAPRVSKLDSYKEDDQDD